MLDVTGNLWTFGDADGDADARVITTNGFVKSNGECVMGRGCAMEARDRYQWLAREVGGALKKYGNRCFTYPIYMTETGLPNFELTAPHDFDIVTFPVKPAHGPNGEPGWSCEAELPLIEKSARELVEMADKFDWHFIVLPRPGSGNGRLRYEAVREVIAPILDDRFYVITFDRSPR